ncbi:hypothetical protein VDF90_08520 [Xanthomonas campestris pv. raphani]|uniref:hypothetical protein n=1 Tax=Xanthomonas campestris TaxID=339 RepID=UPI00137B62AB|nr:hypothetical protein [Xanthomonas campestris]MEA9787290.1 hypothetical protein [Xanthomonas campestris pv. raphani]
MQMIGLSRVRQADCVCGVRNCSAAYIDEQLRSLARTTETGVARLALSLSALLGTAM